ncbi:MAG: aminoacyl-tRNA hydrolase [Xanthomonadaceae bacterium]|nr:aminoacyl-tRNA hydrolase [Xanthomonadaceae bacterium]
MRATFTAHQAVEWRAVRSPGPGGQNVNKVARPVSCVCISPRPACRRRLRARLEKLTGRRVNSEGALLIEVNRFHSQERNRADAWARFEALLTRALVNPKRRDATRVSGGERRKRVDDKIKRGGYQTHAANHRRRRAIIIFIS